MIIYQDQTLPVEILNDPTPQKSPLDTESLLQIACCRFNLFLSTQFPLARVCSSLRIIALVSLNNFRRTVEEILKSNFAE